MRRRHHFLLCYRNFLFTHGLTELYSRVSAERLTGEGPEKVLTSHSDLHLVTTLLEDVGRFSGAQCRSESSWSFKPTQHEAN